MKEKYLILLLLGKSYIPWFELMIYFYVSSQNILFHKGAATPPSKATRKRPKDLVALLASPVKGTTLFPLVITPVALGAADADAPVVPDTWKDAVAVGYGGTRLLIAPTSSAEEIIIDVKPRAVGEAG